MTTTTVAIEFPVSGADCGEIAVTAAEGGIGYWSQIESYKYERWWPNFGDDFNGPTDVDDDFVFYTIREDPNDNGSWDGPPIDITPVVIRRGIQLVNQGVPHTRDDQAAADYPSKWNFEPRQLLDFENVDADQADWIIQLGVFGELVYG